MSRYRHAALVVGSYFFTLKTYSRQPILCEEAVHEANDLVVCPPLGRVRFFTGISQRASTL